MKPSLMVSSGRNTTRVGVLLLASMLISCGGGGGGSGDSTSGGGGGGSPPSAAGRFEESNAAVSLSAGWTASDSNFGWSGGAARQSTVTGALASFTFTGTSVTWIGNRNPSSGIALVKIDGGSGTEVDLFARPNEIRTPVITVNGLSAGQHTLTIEVTGRKRAEALSNIVVLDAFEVQAPVVSHLQETDPDVHFSDGWLQADSNFSWSGGGVATLPDPPVGGARVTDTAGAKVTLTFRGTSINWSGYRGPDAGIARVQLDGGAVSEVDTYSPDFKIQEVVFTATGLADASHTLTIEATGQKNQASTGAQIVVDAFDVTAPGRRFQEEDAAITYSGDWIHGNVNRSWSEGAAATSATAGSRATFTFSGTSVSWIGCRKASIGPARIFLDGVLVKEIDNYEPVPIEAYQHTIFRADGLTNGTHTLTIEAATTGPFIVVDAFDVRP
ncbi:MAG: hypothetical protein ACJ8G2_10370 [Burkholderiales bacterium]